VWRDQAPVQHNGSLAGGADDVVIGVCSPERPGLDPPAPTDGKTPLLDLSVIESVRNALPCMPCSRVVCRWRRG